MRFIIKKGDVFSVKIGETKKKHMQYIANDLTQLNSDVIRAFKKVYSIDESPNLDDVVNDDVDFYAHCILKNGVKMKLWEQIGNNKDIGALDKISFRGTNDYGHKVGEIPIKISEKWYIWNINDDGFTNIGKLKEEYKKLNIGLVFNPLGIIELLKGNKYPLNYPE